MGDQMIMHFPPSHQEANRKLHRPWKGIFTVSKVINPTNIEFVKTPGAKPQAAHIDGVKHFHTLTPPLTVKDLRTRGVLLLLLAW